MLKNELYQGNKKPDSGKMSGVRTPAAEKPGMRKPVEDGSIKNRVNAEWRDKQSDASNKVSDDSENITSKAKATADQSSEFAKDAVNKYEQRTPDEEAAVKSRIDAAWGEKPASGKTRAEYPED